MINILYGTKKLEPIEYRLTKRIIPGKFWFNKNKSQYCIETDYMTLAPFKSKHDAYCAAAYGKITLIDCTGE